MSINGEPITNYNNHFPPELVNIITDITMSYIPYTFLQFVESKDNCINADSPIIKSINEFSELVTHVNYVDFLNILKSLSDESVINIINQLMNKLDFSAIIENNLHELKLPLFNSVNNLSNDQIEKIIADKTFVFISFIIKKFIEGLIKLSIIINPLTHTVSDAVINHKNWNMLDVGVFDDKMKELFENNKNNYAYNDIITNHIEKYLIRPINIVTDHTKIIISDKVQDIINKTKLTCGKFKSKTDIINLVLETADSMFTNFSGYKSIREEILESIDEIIVVMACDMFLTQGRMNKFMEKNAVIIGIASELNSLYKPIICHYLMPSIKH